MATTFTKEQRELLRAHYDHVHEHHADVLEKARRAGYRLASVEDREFLDRRDLYFWNGTLWVKIGEPN